MAKIKVVYTGRANTRRISTELLGHDCDEDGNFDILIWRRGVALEMSEEDFELLKTQNPGQFREAEPEEEAKASGVEEQAAPAIAPDASSTDMPQEASEKGKKPGKADQS